MIKSFGCAGSRKIKKKMIAGNKQIKQAQSIKILNYSV
jgi:hypothetical protein